MLNIFAINSYATWVDYNNTPEKHDGLIDELYQKNLKQTRKNVYKFFAIEKNENINAKYLVRLYPFTLPKDHEVKTEYFKCSKFIDKILDGFKDNKVPNEFLALGDENFKPRDVSLIFIIF